ncbi:MAG TPA: hypothetical protein VKY45_05975 [Marinilabiliaceae bacterium]|nr:hypothetical protein [Marinilabiliaceae bacterium]
MDFYFASVRLSITSAFDDIVFVSFTSKNFTTPLTPPTHFFVGEMGWMHDKLLEKFQLVFTGKAFGDIELPYEWRIHQCESDVAIEIIFEEHPFLKRSVALISSTKGTVNIYLEPKASTPLPIRIDPMEHPLSSLLLGYLAYLSGGFLVHASGVEDEGKGYLFTAVSGTGKSTMAGLWQKTGATIINDDRLWLLPVNGEWYMFNTPMVWYAEEPRMAPLDGIYLLRQSPNNQIKQITGITASMRFMSNCIQHFYDEKMTASHLDRVLALTNQTPIFDLGFKPDHEVVELLRKK